MSLKIRKLALGGGGMKGILQFGVLKRLAELQPLDFPDGVYGCSIGSIIGTLIAFKVPLTLDMAKEHLNFKNVLPKPSFENFSNMFTVKGLYSMELFEEVLVKAFEKEGIDLRTTRIGDAKMPLFIVASNITKGIPTVFSNDVLVKDALKCSCCVPGIFKPQELYGQLYVDGGLFMPCLALIAPDALNLYLTKKRNRVMTLSTIESMSPIDYIRQLYSMSVNQFHKFNKTDMTIDLEYPNLNSESDLDNFDLDKVLEHAGKKLDDFFMSKSAGQKGTE